MHVGDDPRAGTRLAGYRLGTALGRDGVGVVYLAEDVSLGRRVALRLFDPELTADERLRERFLREAELVASFDHPGIVPVYEAGMVEERLYVATARVEGSDLASVLAREGRLEPERALAIVTQLAETLDAARWGRGLVHGALSPAEVLIVPDGEGGSGERVLLRGFGLRRELLPGDRSGALDYLAPEQIEGEPVSPRTDVYALGCLLFECLTGRPPFQGASAEAHLHESPPSVARFCAGLPAEVDRVIARALAKWPEERYSTSTELAGAARSALAPPDEQPRQEERLSGVRLASPSRPAPPEDVPPPGSTDEAVREELAPKPGTRRKAIAAVGLAVLLAAVAAGLTWLASRDTDESSSASSAPPALGFAPDGVTVPEAEASGEQPLEPEPSVQSGEGEPGPFGAGSGDDAPALTLSRLPGSLVQMGATTGVILSRVAIPFPRLLASDGRFVWLLGGEDGTERLVRIDAAANGGTAIFDAAGLLEREAEGSSSSDLAAVRGDVWLNDQQGTAYRLARAASAAEAVTFADPGGGSLNFVGRQVAAAGSLWVSAFPPGPCCTPPPDLYRVDPATGEVMARIEDASEVVAVGSGFVWALGEHVLGNRPELVRIDTETHATVPIGVLDFSWVDFAVADGAVWASSPEDGTIVRLDPPTGEERERIGVGGAPRALAAGGGAVWAAIRNGTVARYDIGTGEIETFDVGGTPNGLVFAAGSVWVAVDEPLPQAELPLDVETAGAVPQGCGAGEQVAPGGPEPAGEAAVVADYRFQRSLASSGSAPDLVEVGDGLVVFDREALRGRTRAVLRFGRGSGLALTPTAGVIDSEHYTIELLFRFRLVGGYRKIIDFKNAADDRGLYNLDGCLSFFDTAVAPRATIEPGSYMHVVLKRDASASVVGYVNGVRQFSFLDTNGLAEIDTDGSLRFFQDDSVTGGEYSGGAVARIRLYDGPLSDDEVSRACAELMGERSRRACR